MARAMLTHANGIARASGPAAGMDLTPMERDVRPSPRSAGASTGASSGTLSVSWPERQANQPAARSPGRRTPSPLLGIVTDRDLVKPWRVFFDLGAVEILCVQDAPFEEGPKR